MLHHTVPVSLLCTALRVQKKDFRQERTERLTKNYYLCQKTCISCECCVRDTATVSVRHFSRGAVVLTAYTRSVLGRFLLFLLFQTKPRTLSTYLRPTGPFSYLMCLLSQSKPSLKPRFSKTEHICRCSCRPSPLRWTWLGSGLGLGLGSGSWLVFRVRVKLGLELSRT